MKVLKVKEYLKRYNQDPNQSYMNDYVVSLAKGSQSADMVEFHDPEFLAGAFSGKFGLLTVTSYLKSQKFELKTQAEQMEDYLKYSQGFYSLDPLLSGIDQSRKFISGGYNKVTGNPVDGDKYGKSIHRFFCEKLSDKVLTLNHPYLEEDICSKSELSSKDTLMAVLSALDKYPVEDIKISIQNSLNNMDRMTEEFFTDANTYPSLELPYRVRLAGNDDASWGMCYSSVEEANKVRNEIIAKPDWDTINKHLLFTN